MPPSPLSLRQRMAWLHTWCGLVGAWLLCMIFLAGTLSVFREPITRWMSAEPPLPALSQPVTEPPSQAHPHTSPAALTAAWQWLEAQAAEAAFWRLELPAHADQALRMFWRPPGAGRSTEEVALDPRDGALLPQPWGRRTESGRHFMVLHYTLHAGTAGFWLVGGLSMAMLVLLISGVVVHKRIFADFFTFRPGKGLRSWLDAHNATGVLTLPFQLMIVYSGLAIFYTTYMPGALWGAYGSDPAAQMALAAKQATPGVARDTGSGTGSSTPVQGTTLPALLAEAYPQLGAPVHRIVVTRPGTAQAQIRVLGQIPDSSTSRQLRNSPGNALFSAATGAQLSAPRTPESTGSTSAHAVLQHLHLATYGGWTLKWLYFVLGLAGTAMIATGSLLFSIKRRQKLDPAFGSVGARAHQLIEGIHVAAIAGATLASIGYLVINRLLPADAPDRIQSEITLFFLLWLASLGHALLRPYRQAWVEQLGATALLCLLLPALNVITTGQWVFSYLAQGNLESAMVELTVLALGGVLAWTTWRVQQKKMPPRYACGCAAPQGGAFCLGAARRQKNTTARAMPRPSNLPGPTARQRWQTLAQVMAAVVGGYAVVLLGTYVLGHLWVQLMAASGVSAVLVLTLSSFVVYAGVATWAMTRPSAWGAWRGLTTVGLSLGLLALVLGQAT